MPSKPRTGTPIQRFIVATLAEKGLTRYWLAQQCGWRPDRIYKMLTQPTKHVNVEMMLAVLDIRLRSGSTTLRMRINRKGDAVTKE